MRIGPKGILALQDRLRELKNRVGADDYDANVIYGNAVEKLLQKNVTVSLGSITDKQLNSHRKNLLKIEI